MFTRLSENTGFPALTVPMGVAGPKRLPAGLEFLGRPYAEPTLLELGAAYEKATSHRHNPKL